jgi:hypothetical protein
MSTTVPSSWIVSSLTNNDDDDDDDDDDDKNNNNNDDPNNSNIHNNIHNNSNNNNHNNHHHLFVHFDINETILLGDEAGGDSRHDSIQKMLAKSAFVQMTTTTTTTTTTDNNDNNFNNFKKQHTDQMHPTHWWDGQIIGQETSMPPLYTGWEWPPNCCPYYRTAYKPNAQTFTQHHPIYQPLLQKCQEALLAAAATSSVTNNNNNDDEQQDHSIIILPAFYETLQYLIQTRGGGGGNNNKNNNNDHPPRFTVVFRTFGSDLPGIADMVSNFAQGKHPQYSHIDYPPLIMSQSQQQQQHLYQGRWWKKQLQRNNDNGDDNGDDSYIYQLWNYPQEDTLIASGDEEIVQLFLSLSQSNTAVVVGIRDDYDHWKKHHYHPTAGKPIWVMAEPPSTTTTTTTSKDDNSEQNHRNSSSSSSNADYHYPQQQQHHILFDDNIHNLPHDSIVCIRQQQPHSNNNGGTYTSVVNVVDNEDWTRSPLYHGIHVCRVPTVEPVLNPRWFIEQIETAQQKLWSQQQQRERRRLRLRQEAGLEELEELED